MMHEKQLPVIHHSSLIVLHFFYFHASGAKCTANGCGAIRSQMMDDAGDDAPDLKLHVGLNLKRRIGAIVGHEEEFAFASGETFDGQFAVQNGDDDACVLRFERTVNDEYVARMNPGVNHRIAGDADEEGGGRMLGKMAA